MSSSSVQGVREDLSAAAMALQEAENALIAALEAGAKLKDVEELEATVQRLTLQRNDLAETTDFVIKRERDRSIRDGRMLSTVQFIASWSESLSAARVPAMMLEDTSRNEGRGLTGTTYVFRGWFAQYIEGEESMIDLTMKEIANDDRYGKIIVLKRQCNLPAGTPRHFPDKALLIHWMNNPLTPAHHVVFEEATVVHFLCQQMAFLPYVPRSILSPEEHSALRSSGVAIEEVTQTLQRVKPAGEAPRFEHYIVSISPQSDAFWFKPDCIDRVSEIYDLAKLVWERPAADSALVAMGSTLASSQATLHLGSVIGPHSSERLLVASGRYAEEAIRRSKIFFDRLEKEFPETFSAYQPNIAIHSGEIQAPLNGTITVVGPMLRYLRFLGNVARQEQRPMVISYKVADEALRVGVTSVGHFLYERRPDEIFMPTALASRTWKPEVAPPPTVIGDANEEGGAPQVIAGDHPRRTGPPVPSPLTNDELNVKPPPGFVSEDEIRAAFESLMPDPETNTISMETFSAYYQGCDQMGVNEQVAELEDRLTAFMSREYQKTELKAKQAATGGGKSAKPQAAFLANRQNRRITFDQFALMWYHRMKD
jgi:hypothetical protein